VRFQKPDAGGTGQNGKQFLPPGPHAFAEGLHQVRCFLGKPAGSGPIQKEETEQDPGTEHGDDAPPEEHPPDAGRKLVRQDRPASQKGEKKHDPRVDHALKDDGADGFGPANAEIDAREVSPVNIPQLGRDHIVHKILEEDDELETGTRLLDG